MNKLELEAFSFFSQSYTRLKDLNETYRTKFDRYDEFYRGYRDTSKYPFAYNYSFQKIIPVIYTMLSSMMGQLYKNNDVVVVKPRQQNDVIRAETIQGVLNYQLNNMNDIDYQGGSYLIFMQWILSTLVHGKGIVRAYWRTEERTMPRRMDLQIPQFDTDGMGNAYISGYDTRQLLIEETQTVYDAPYLENIPVRFFFPDPGYRSIQKMPVVCHLHVKSMEWLKQKEKEGVYKNVGEIGKYASNLRNENSNNNADSEEMKQKAIEIEGANTIEEIESTRHKGNNIDIVDCYGKYALQKGGPEVEVICTIANHDTIIQLKKSRDNVRPFFDMGAHLNMERYWDIGVIELVQDTLEAYNNMANLRIHNSMMKVNTMISVLRDSDIDPESLVWKPFGVIPLDDHDDIRIQDTPDLNAQVFSQQMGFFESIIQDITGIYDYAKGVTPDRQERVGTMYSLQSVAQARIKLLLMTMDYMGIRPLLKYMTLLNTYNLPSGTEYRVSGKGGKEFGRVFSDALHLKYDFEARYAAMEPALAKESRVQHLLALSQAWQQDPTVNNYEFKRAILELTDMPQPDRFLRDPQQVAKQQAQMAAKAAQQEMAKIYADTSSKEGIAKLKADTDIETTDMKVAGDLVKQMLISETAETVAEKRGDH